MMSMPSFGSKHRLIFYFLTVAIPFGVLSIGEFVINEREQKQLAAIKRPTKSQWLQPDPARGWANRHGKFLAKYEGKEIEFHMGSIGERVSTPKTQFISGADRILIGDSFTFGVGVTAEKTFGSLIAKAKPSESVINLGVSGYSGYQSYLSLADIFRRVEKSKAVIYSFIDVSDMRNVATYEWQQLLSWGGRVAQIPEALSLIPGQLIERPPHHLVDAYEACHFPGLLCFGRRYIRRSEDLVKRLSAKRTTKELLIRMRDLSHAHGASFSVLMFGSGFSEYEEFLNESGIKFSTLDYHQFPRLLDDPHPAPPFYEAVAAKVLKEIWN